MTNAKSTQINQPFNKLINFFDAETILYIIKRVLQGLLTILLASILSFIIIQIAPGNYLDTLKQNPKIAEETIKQLTEQFGLDQPWYVQYWRWLVQVVTELDFGTSFVYNRSVASLLAERIPATLLLAVSSIILTWLIAIPLGILSAVKQSSWTDKILRVISYLGQGFPSFITALVLLILAQYLSPLLPVGNMTSLNHAELSPVGKILDIGWHMILPTIALSITSFAGLMRLMRGQMLDVMRQDYIQTARAKGLPEDKVIYIHALRNAVNPLITLLGFEFASLLGGAFIAEFFFNWPGLGRLVLQAVTAQDLYLVMGSLTMGATMLIVGNLLADLLLKAVDPRIKLENLK
ncbi:binding protein dependent transport systems inner membrane component [Crocosphaera subtropica ATCC 51142]|uniref:Binding protein dependent transport systems inner membrane component n=1 Tax=Crocosphaera subtropica (strain ATCC 51142 / BH68) TaxID=43989 RepID=B1WQD6_CROS5|nr:ABC transporter permease [Crocosphaera subtropica]ACB51647.1 binding protein dependent transport systems inner membrane component [Crocosphaera subtropica ATCC 51142]